MSNSTNSEDYEDYEDYYDFPDEFYKIFETIQFFVNLFSILVNTIHLFILTRKSMRTSSVNILMAGIALCDLYVMGYTAWDMYTFIFYDDYDWECTPPSHFYIRIGILVLSAILKILRRLSAWLSLLMAFVRYLAIKNALNSKFDFLSEPIFGVKLMLVSFLLSSLATLFFYGNVRLKKTTVPWTPSEICEGFPVDYSVPDYMQLVESFLFLDGMEVQKVAEFINGVLKFVPTLIFPIVTFLLVLNLRSANKLRQKTSTSKGENSKTDQTTYLVILIAITYMIAEGPYAIITAIHAFTVGSSILWGILTILSPLIGLNTITHLFICLAISSQYQKAGKCSLYVNELMFLTDDEDFTLEAAKNISKVCQSVTNCFGEIQCADAQKNKELYTQKCEKLDYKNYELIKCMTNFYDITNNKLSNCTEEFDYASNNLSIKRKAFTSGKSCFMSVVETNCSSKSVAYFTSNYESFLNVLTVPPSNNGKCNSVHDQLTALPCHLLRVDLLMNTMRLGMSMGGGSSRQKSLSTTCEKLMECTRESCYFSEKNGTAHLEELCAEINSTQLNLDFTFCLVSILGANLTSYDCVPSNATMPRFLKPTNQPNFYDDKECAKTLMIGECGQDLAIDFDQNWNQLVEDMRNETLSSNTTTRLDVNDLSLV
ncbi:unnamed protein product [Caenorhabditis brenneri]